MTKKIFKFKKGDTFNFSCNFEILKITNNEKQLYKKRTILRGLFRIG